MTIEKNTLLVLSKLINGVEPGSREISLPGRN